MRIGPKPVHVQYYQAPWGSWYLGLRWFNRAWVWRVR